MRGKAYEHILAIDSARITPAHAGKRRDAGATDTRGQDHPRPCGEKDDKHIDLQKERGSPPPMRGKVFNIAAVSGLNGITPAHAGKSLKGCLKAGR